ncbi:MAG TPA: hypothetical protein DD001_19650 [Microcoleaceae bacterium UBA10368]|jgi:hypothetical protein|nr:hypothetical protein [Microcoleaceae cyanobacterium UBA10368]HCV32970.1 hypothetical protein [Microcoleaceae cyanobacterium UBA9251]
MSFADEMRRKSLEAQSNAAKKALELEKSKRDNCIPNLKKDIQEAASKGLCEVIIKSFLDSGEWRNKSGILTTETELKTEFENLELNSLLEMYSSKVDEWDRMRIAFIKSEPGLSLTRVVEVKGDGESNPPKWERTILLKVVW